MFPATTLHAFSDEFVKIAKNKSASMASGAAAGGLVGAGIGAMFPGNRIKGGLYGGLAGGVIGGAVGGLASAGKRILHPSPASQGPPTGDPNYVPSWQQGYQ